MTGNDLRSLYLEFFCDQGHQILPPAPIVPLNDPTTLFNNSGMQSLVPYFKGEPHPQGKRLADSQPCFRSDDIPEVGDNRHTTFFEMLGNWSLGDYFKAEQLPWFFTFLTQALHLHPDRLYVTVFAGDAIAPRDDLSIQIWQSLFKTSAPAKLGTDGFHPSTKIYYYPASKNWWSRAGVPQNMPVGEIGGPDSEVFYDFGEELKFHQNSPYADTPCHVNCDCGRFLEIGNSVFMEYIKTETGDLAPLPSQNVDFGGGLERLLAATSQTPDIFQTDLFLPLIQTIETITSQSYSHPDNQSSMRLIADHLKGAVFLLHGGVVPDNKLQGYFLRRLLRRIMVKCQGLKGDLTQTLDDLAYRCLVETAIGLYQPIYFPADFNPDSLTQPIISERDRFQKTLNQGVAHIKKTPPDQIDGRFAFNLYQSYGLPLEITLEIASSLGIQIDTEAFAAEFTRHQELSRSTSAGMFKGGLADQSATITQYHTVTHLLHQALREVLGPTVQQMGSHITNERLRFDFKFDTKLTPEQQSEILAIVNAKIAAGLPVHKTIESKEAAIKSGALAFFRQKYPDTVSVYTIGLDPQTDWYSKELCGGPHVSSTAEISPVTIKKEAAVGAGVRRLYLSFKRQ